MQLFGGRGIKYVFTPPNQHDFYGVHAEKIQDEPVNYEQMDQKILLVECAKKGITGVDGRSSKANIIAALRTLNADNADQD